MNLKELWSQDFLFSINRVSVERIDYWFAYFAAAILVAAIVVRVFAWKSSNPWRQRMLRQWFGLGLFFSICGLLWFGARYQLINVLGTHATYYLILLASLIWAGVLVYRRFTIYKDKLTAWSHEQEKAKYLNLPSK